MTIVLHILDLMIIIIGMAILGAIYYRKIAREGFWLTVFGITLTLSGVATVIYHTYTGIISPSLYRDLASITLLVMATTLVIASGTFARIKCQILCLAALIAAIVATQFYDHLLRSYLLENVYALICLVISAYFIRKSFARSDYQYRRRSNIIFTGLLIIGFLFWNNIILNLYNKPANVLYIFATTGVLAIVMLVDLPFYEIALSREQVLENMADGWMLLDQADKVVDINGAASILLGANKKEIVGKHLADILAEKYKLTLPELNNDINFQLEAHDSEQNRYYNIHVVHIDEKFSSLKKIVFWRDITDFQKAELARQKARDEMTLLIHAISRAAIEHASQKDFLHQAIMQITHSFHCTSGIFWVFELSDSNQLEITPSAWTGIADKDIKHISEELKQADLTDFLGGLDKYHFFPDALSASNLNLRLDSMPQSSLLVEPLFNSNELLGMLWLMREPQLEYSLEELTRLALVVDEVATLHYFNKQNQAAVIAAERQRLMRDLHDSVTQRLYGLVALTEAAQAGIATGSGHIQPQIITRIGEHARQAIKEMRLFLHQLQPINFEKETLVMLLHRRLAAVEGRSDVRTQFDADLTLTFSQEKQKAIYFIAQEALNNTLRHASAKNVILVLKKTPRGAIFTITDDGQGFDGNAWDTGGMGIRNMKARAKEINARLTIKSSPGQGTQVKVWIPNHNTFLAKGKKGK